LQLAKTVDSFQEDQRNKITITSHSIKDSDSFSGQELKDLYKIEIEWLFAYFCSVTNDLQD